LKADGLAAGKGVLLCQTRDESLAALDTIMKIRPSGRPENKWWWKSS
jgi:phosphoribosylamine-glycine ligase